MGVTGKTISKWANGIGLSASFDPCLVKEFAEIASAEYRALGITTALSPQIDLATEPRWMGFADTFGEHTQMTIDMTKAYCDGFQTTKGSSDGWGEDSVNTMVKHFPGGGMGEAGRDAHYAYGKYAVYPGRNFKEHLRPFAEAADARFRRSAYRLLLNIFRTGLFENPYLNMEESLQTVGCLAFREKGYQSQLKSITMLKNKNHVLPLKEGIKVYIPDRFIKSYMNFMSMPTGDQTVIPPGKKAALEYFEVVPTPDEADAALCFIESPISVGYDSKDRKSGGNGYVPITLQYRPYQADLARTPSLAGGAGCHNRKVRAGGAIAHTDTCRYENGGNTERGCGV